MIPIYQDLSASQNTFIICVHSSMYSQFLDDNVLNCPTETEITITFQEEGLIFQCCKYGSDFFLFTDCDHNYDNLEILMSFGNIFPEDKRNIYMHKQELKSFISWKNFLDKSAVCKLSFNGTHLNVMTLSKETKEIAYDAERGLQGKKITGWLQLKQVRINRDCKNIFQNLHELFEE